MDDEVLELKHLLAVDRDDPRQVDLTEGIRFLELLRVMKIRLVNLTPRHLAKVSTERSQPPVALPAPPAPEIHNVPPSPPPGTEEEEALPGSFFYADVKVFQSTELALALAGDIGDLCAVLGGH